MRMSVQPYQPGHSTLLQSSQILIQKVSHQSIIELANKYWPLEAKVVVTCGQSCDLLSYK
jgi:hypothetical protein